jgi:hypothetical protein
VKHVIRKGDRPEAPEKNNNEHSFRLWLWDGNEVVEVRKYLNKLEASVILLQTDYIDIMGHLYQGNRNNKIFEQCYHTYETLDNLVRDLKNVRITLNDSYSYYSCSKQLESFFHRFRDTLIRICSEIKNDIPIPEL